eukprot:3551045-Alexandrium_andersonii.AAC.1
MALATTSSGTTSLGRSLVPGVHPTVSAGLPRLAAERSFSSTKARPSNSFRRPGPEQFLSGGGTNVAGRPHRGHHSGKTCAIRLAERQTRPPT